MAGGSASAARSDTDRPASIGKRARKYERGKRAEVKGVRDKKLRTKLKKNEARLRNAARSAAEAELLLPSDAGYLEVEGMERTWKVKQAEIVDAVDLQTAAKSFSLSLDMGPYRCAYSRNGRYMVLGGAKGHVALLDWQAKELSFEVGVGEAVRDVVVLHNETMTAVAQKKYTYVYDNRGIELHCMRDHIDVNRLEFLPYHFLLASVGNAGWLKYQDTSTGQLVAQHRTRLGACSVMRQNPSNAVLCLGHGNGTVTMWSPNMNEPLVRMLCHRGTVRAVAVDREGLSLITAGVDSTVKVWDLRTYRLRHEYRTTSPAVELDVSQRGLLAVGLRAQTVVWKDALEKRQASPYVVHRYDGDRTCDVAFCPFEDVLAVGTSKGLASIVVPGSGEPNFDSFEVNPFATPRQRSEATVHSLLEKLQPEMIGLDANVVGTVSRTAAEAEAEARAKADAANNVVHMRKKARGRNKVLKRLKRKQDNVVDQKREELREKLAKEEEARKRLREPIAPKKRSALDRFERNPHR